MAEQIAEGSRKRFTAQAGDNGRDSASENQSNTNHPTSPRLRLTHLQPIASGAVTAECLYIGDGLQAKVLAMGLLAQLFRHKNSPPREGAMVPEPDSDTRHTEVRGVGAVAEQIRAADALVAPANTVHIPVAPATPAAPAPRAPTAPTPTTPAPTTPAPEAVAQELGAVQMPTEPTQELAAPPEPAPSEKITESVVPDEPVPITPIVEPVAAAPTPVPALEISQPEIPPPEVFPPAVTLPKPALHEVPPPVFAATGEQPEQPRELRPEKDVAISSTLRAVVLGGVAPSGSADAPNSAAQILAPRVTVKATATPVPMVLGPSVIPSANAGGILLAPRTTPDFAALQKLFMTDSALDLDGVAALAAVLPGARACVISGAAGNAAVGDFSHGVSADAVRLASANLVQRAGPSMETLKRDGSDVAIFLHGDTCVAVILTSEGFVPGVRDRLVRTAELLARAQPAPAR